MSEFTDSLGITDKSLHNPNSQASRIKKLENDLARCLAFIGAVSCVGPWDLGDKGQSERSKYYRRKARELLEELK